MNLADLHTGDRVWRWWDAGPWMDAQPLTVVRVNRITATVRTDGGSTFRLPPQMIVGPWTEDGSGQPIDADLRG